jgi:hypothetical protein
MSYILVSSYFMRAIDFFGSCSGFEMSIPFANNLRTCCIAFFLIAEMDRIRSDEIAKEGQQLRKHYEGTIRALANQTPTTVAIFWRTSHCFPRVSSCFVPTGMAGCSQPSDMQNIWEDCWRGCCSSAYCAKICAPSVPCP